MVKQLEELETKVDVLDIIEEIPEPVFIAQAQINPVLSIDNSIKSIRKYINEHYKNTVSKISMKNTVDKNLKASLIEALEAEVGLVPTGIWSEELAAKVKEHRIAPGTKGIFVTLWQCALNCNNYILPITGVVTFDTTVATQKAQREHGLFPGGVVQPELWKNMLS